MLIDEHVNNYIQIRWCHTDKDDYKSNIPERDKKDNVIIGVFWKNDLLI